MSWFIKFQRKIFIIFVFFLLFLPLVSLAESRFFSDPGKILVPVDDVVETSGYVFNSPTLSVEFLVGILRIVFSFLGAAFFLIIVYAGWRWMTASGNEEQITKAKQSLIQASIGFGLVVLAYAITFLVITVLGSGAQYNTGVTPAEDCPYGVC